jgi:metallophosphoesterase (TIGR03767 family)
VRATRRTVLKGLAAGAAAAVAGPAAGPLLFPSRSASAAAAPLAGEGTTLAGTVVRPDVDGYTRLASGPGEPHVVRDELGTPALGGRQGRRTPLLAFAHLTDIHVIDAQSPARVEFLDRYNDGPGSPLFFGAAYRPQEFLSPQIADSIVAAVDRTGRGPVSRRALDFAICTGDNTDNAQLNELRWQIDLLDGTPFRPDSGSTDQFEGVHDSEPTSYDIHYWHPDGPPEGKNPDNAIAQHGFPVIKGLLDAARRPFTPVGLSMPWFTAYGNHDGLVQGNFPQSFQLTRLAEGPLKIVSLPAGASPDDVQRGLTAGDPGVLNGLVVAPARTVTADPMRKVISRTESVKEHFTTGGLPLGHGFTAQNVTDGTAYYAFDAAPAVRGIVLDSVNPNGESSGSLDQEQFAWLRARLEEVTGPGRDRLVVVFSHHTIDTMTNRIVFVDDPSPRVLGEQVKALLLEFPNVVLWVNGHTHVNRVAPHTRSTGGGFWEVQTAAHVDFPCQARLLEVLDNRDGTLSVFGTILDADAPLSYDGLDSARSLASLGRELAANDPQERGNDRRGAVEDRNVELLIPAPFDLGRAAAPVETAASAAPAASAMPEGARAADGVARPAPAVAGRALPATGGADLVAAGAVAATVAGLALRGRASHASGRP